MDYQIKPLTVEFIQINQDQVFDSWHNMWVGSIWGDQNVTKKEELEYLSFAAEKGCSFIIMSEDKIIGFLLTYFNYHHRPKNDDEKHVFKLLFEDNSQPYLYLQDMVIDPNYRGHGISKALFKLMMSECQKRQVSRIVLWAEKSSWVNSYYQKLGFKYVGEVIVADKTVSVGREHRCYYQLTQ